MYGQLILRLRPFCTCSAPLSVELTHLEGDGDARGQARQKDRRGRELEEQVRPREAEVQSDREEQVNEQDEGQSEGHGCSAQIEASSETSRTLTGELNRHGVDKGGLQCQNWIDRRCR